MTLQCKTCRTTVTPLLRWVGPHVRASCPGCGAYIKMLPQTREVLEAVGPRPHRHVTGDLFRDDADAHPTLPGTFKCGRCGRTLPESERQPGLPPVWASCRACHEREKTTRTEWTNPLGPTAEATDTGGKS